MDTQKTPVEWLINELDYETISKFDKQLGQAKEMEKEQQGYSEEEVRNLLQSQRNNCYVAILTKTRDIELASLTTAAPEPSGKNGWVKQYKNK